MRVPFVSLEPMHAELSEPMHQVFDNVFSANEFIMGKRLLSFEKNYANYCNTEFAVGCGTGLDALYLIIRALGIGDGDEVIVPVNSFVATALAVSYTGAMPVFVEPCKSTSLIDVNEIEEKITDKTRAIIAVHLYGRCADMDYITNIAKKYHLYVIEDAAQAHGAMYKGRRAGSLGDAAGFSFYPGKNLGALGDGGMVVTSNREIAEKVRMYGNYGSSVKYHHELLGNNSRLDEMQAAFLDLKLAHLEQWNMWRNNIAERYLQGIDNPFVDLPAKADHDGYQVWHVFSIHCKKRDELKLFLEKRNIGTNIHYPIPIHLQQCYSELGYRKGDFPIAEYLADTELSLPMYYGMTEEEVDYVIESINIFR